MSKPDWTEAPEGATHWDTRGAVWCKHLYFWCYGRWNYEGEIHDLAEDRYTPRPVGPATTAWDCTGLPPVGTECEVVIGALKPRTVCFVGIKSSGSVVIETVDGELKSYHRSQVNFRPVRTQAQRERDEFVDFAARAYLSDRLESAPNLSGEQARKIAAFFYDAGMLRRAGE